MADLGTIGITDEHRELHATARRWVEAHVDPKATRAMLDLTEPALPDFWDALRATGWFGIHLPEALGGEGYGLLELAVVLEELGRACAPGPFLSTVAVSAVLADAVRDSPGDGGAGALAAIVRSLATAGRVAGIAASRSWFSGAELSGVDDGDGGYWLDGTLPWVLGGTLVDEVLVPFTYIDDDEYSTERFLWGVVAVTDPGVTVTSRVSVDGTRPVASIRCDGTPLRGDRVVRPGPGRSPLELLSVLASAEAVGSMAWCVETATEHAKVREQFGRPIGQFQAVKHRCADMAVHTEAARAVVWDAVRPEEDPEQQALTASLASTVAHDAYFAVSKDCIQVLGGIGYTWEHDAHVFAKRALANRQLLGSGRIWSTSVAERVRSGQRRRLSMELPAEAEEARAEVRAFVSDMAALPKLEWNRHLADHGYLVPHWPRPWGRDASAIEQLVIDEELTAARIRRPHLQVAAWVLPTIINHGTMAQQERWVRPTLRGELLWCQLFSEPGAGSDLASLQMRAVRVDGGWELTGQKVWTTMAHLAQWGLCVARSSPDKRKHEGITAFVVDMASPGIDIRPLRELTGAEMFNEVFFDGVFVPDDAVIGEVDHGWEAARTTLANERVSMGSGSSFGPNLEAYLALDSPERREAFFSTERSGQLVAEGHAVAVLGLRTTLRAMAGVEPGPESSVRKLLGVEHEQKVQEAALDLLGPEAVTTDGDAAPWVHGFFGNRALSIAGGTSDIQRNIVAERLLGLPKDP